MSISCIIPFNLIQQGVHIPYRNSSNVLFTDGTSKYNRPKQPTVANVFAMMESFVKKAYTPVNKNAFNII